MALQETKDQTTDSGIESSGKTSGENFQFVSSTSALTGEEARNVVKSCWNKIENDGNGPIKSEIFTETGKARTVRVFVSSTFSDFHSEREFLAKDVRCQFLSIGRIIEAAGTRIVT